MYKRLLLWVGLALVGLVTGCASAPISQSGATVLNPEGSIGGRLAPEYQAQQGGMDLGSNFYRYRGPYTSAPVRVVNGIDPNLSTAYQGGTELSPLMVSMRNGVAPAGGVTYAGGVPVAYGSRGFLGSRFADRRYQRQMNPYSGIDPYAGNPYAGNTLTRGPRDFLMKNPPNIGP